MDEQTEPEAGNTARLPKHILAIEALACPWEEIPKAVPIRFGTVPPVASAPRVPNGVEYSPLND